MGESISDKQRRVYALIRETFNALSQHPQAQKTGPRPDKISESDGNSASCLFAQFSVASLQAEATLITVPDKNTRMLKITTPGLSVRIFEDETTSDKPVVSFEDGNEKDLKALQQALLLCRRPSK